MQSRILLFAVCGTLFSRLTCGTSIISTFSDANCQDSITSLDGPNGYPNGTCVDLRRSGQYGSFQIVGLDSGCAVTLYMDDTTQDVCSGFQNENTQIASCYNSTWVYYSIDFCDPPTAGLSTSPSQPATTSLSAPVPPPPPPQEDASSSTSHTGAIAGGAVGGLLGLALIIGATVYFTRRSLMKSTSVKGVYESSGEAINELYAEPAKEMSVHTEIYEKTGSVPALPPVELPTERYDRGSKATDDAA